MMSQEFLKQCIWLILLICLSLLLKLTFTWYSNSVTALACRVLNENPIVIIYLGSLNGYKVFMIKNLYWLYNYKAARKQLPKVFRGENPHFSQPDSLLLRPVLDACIVLTSNDESVLMLFSPLKTTFSP